MKLKVLSLLLASVVVANAGWLASTQSFFDKSISTEPRNLSAYGQNPRAYVFSVEAKDGAKRPMQCIIVYTEQDLGEKNAKSTAPVMQCIPLDK